MKKTKIALIVVCALAAALMLVACAKIYTVTFDPNGGSIASGEALQTVNEGEAATPPTPERQGYLFEGWEGDYTAVTGDVIGSRAMMEQLSQGGYDIVLANIVADVIIPLSTVVPHFLRENGVFICSGILNTRLDEVLAAIGKAGLRVTETEQQEDWCRVTATL